jgi:hypothetical protein
MDQAGAPWMIIGGIAIIARGVRRMTGDIDAVVQGDAVSLDTLVASLKRRQIVARIENAKTFARANLVFLARHAPTGVDLDISLAWTAFEIEAIAEREQTAYGQVRVPMARAEDLVIFKALAARPKDMEDASTLLALHRKVDIARIRRRLSELAQLAEEPTLIDGLEAVIAEAHVTERPVRRAARGRAGARKRRGPRRRV